MSDPQQPPVSPAGPSPRRRRARTISAVLVGILACLALVVATTVVWVHQVAFNTDRWVALTSTVANNPTVVDTVSERISQEVVDALDVRGRLTTALPENTRLLAGPISATIQDRLQARIATLLESPQFQAAWAEANRFAHTTLMTILRGDSTVITLENGVVTLNLFPLVGAALSTLQSEGIIPASVSLPDLTATEAPEAARAAIQTALGVTLPADFGVIPLVRAERLQTARTAVRIFDLLTILAIVLTVVLFALAAALARDRRRAAVLLGAGAVIALVIARAIIRGAVGAITGSVADSDAQTTVRAVLDDVLADLFGIMVLVAIVGAIVAVIAWLLGRREQIRGVVTSAGTAVRRTTAGGIEAGRAMAAGAAATVGAEAASPLDTALAWARANRSVLRLGGLLVAAAWLAILAVGWEAVAIIGGLLVLYEVGLDPLLARGAEETAT